MARLLSLLFGALLIAFALWFYLRPKAEPAGIQPASAPQTASAAPAIATVAAPPATPAPADAMANAPKSAYLAGKWPALETAGTQAKAMGVATAAAWLREDTNLSAEDQRTLRAYLVANLPEAIGEVVRTGETDLALSLLGTLKFLAPEDQAAYDRAIQIWADALAESWPKVLHAFGGSEPQTVLAEMDLVWLYPANDALVEIYQNACLRRVRQYAERNPGAFTDWLTEAATARPAEGGPLLAYLTEGDLSIRALEQAGLRLIAASRAELAVPFLQAALAKSRQSAPVWGYDGTPAAADIQRRLTANLARAWIASGDALRVEPRTLRTTLTPVACFERARELLPDDPQIRELVEARRESVAAAAAPQ